MSASTVDTPPSTPSAVEDRDCDLLPIGDGDVQVKFPPGRDSRLPSIFVMKDHPLHSGLGVAYYFIHDGSMEGSKKTYNLEVNELKIPQGPREEAIALGFLELNPGDIIFSRLRTAPSTGKADVAVLWVTGRGIYSSAMQQEALLARDGALGNRELRTRDHATWDPNTGTAQGGTNWERSLEGKFNEKRGRCYAFGCTYQRQRALYSPCAAGKLSIANDATIKMRSDLAKVTLEMAMLSLKQGPRDIVEAIRINHEILNTPRVGTDENFAFTSNQLNLAHIREWESTESLADSMGQKFGGAHIDQLDLPGHYTNMIALSDLPEGCDPGRFFIVYPGVFCTLHNFVSVNFLGLRVHGGSPPIAAKNTTADEMIWAARCTVVGYAKIGPTSADRKMPIVQLDPDAVLSVTPEMMRTVKTPLTKKVNATNFVVEGPTLLSPTYLMMFLTRCLFLIILATLSELPVIMDVKIDSDTFFGSFYYTDVNGARRRVTPWTDGPGWRKRGLAGMVGVDIPVRDDHLLAQDQHVSVQRAFWLAHERKHGGHIPSAVCCLQNIYPLEDWVEGQPLEKIKPLLFGKGKGDNSKPKRAETGKPEDAEPSMDTSDEEPVPPPLPPKTKAKRKRKAKKQTGSTVSKSNKGKKQDSELDPESEEFDPVPEIRARNFMPSSSTVGVPSKSVGESSMPQSRNGLPRLIPYVLVPTVPGVSTSRGKAVTLPSAVSPSSTPSHSILPPVIPSDMDVLSIVAETAPRPECVSPAASMSDLFGDDPANSADDQPEASEASGERRLSACPETGTHAGSCVASPLVAATRNSGPDDVSRRTRGNPADPVENVLRPGPSQRQPPSLRALQAASSDTGMAVDPVNVDGSVDTNRHSKTMSRIMSSADANTGSSAAFLASPSLTVASASSGTSEVTDRSSRLSVTSGVSGSSSVHLGKRPRSESTHFSGTSTFPDVSGARGSSSDQVPLNKRMRPEYNDQLATGNNVADSKGVNSDMFWPSGIPKTMNDIWDEQVNTGVHIQMIECKLRTNLTNAEAEELSSSSCSSDVDDDIERQLDMPLYEERINLRELPRYLQGITSDIVNQEVILVRKDVTALAVHPALAASLMYQTWAVAHGM